MKDTLQLKPNDKVAIISPASCSSDNQLLLKGIELLNSWGLDVINLANETQWNYLAATDIERASAINQAFADDKIKAIFCVRGGYGCARLNDYLDWQIIKASRKIIVGFSDITYLHLALQNTNHCCIHGPNIGTSQLHDSIDCQSNRKALYDILFSKETRQQFKLTPIIAGDTNGELTGGCLSIIVTTLGTAHEINTTNKILFIEDVNESVYRIDRMLTHLQQAGKLTKVNGIVFGNCYKQTDKLLFTEIITDFFKDSQFPVYCDFPFGHATKNLPWMYSNHVSIRKDKLAF